MNTVVILGHGQFAFGLKSSAHLILGEQPQFFGINFDGDKTAKEFAVDIERELKSFFDFQVIFLVDIQGGTPFIAAGILKEKYNNSLIFSGVNLPLVIELLSQRETNTNDNVNIDLLLSETRDSITVFEGFSEKVNDVEEKDSEGI